MGRTSYKVRVGPSTWQEAQAYCIGKGMVLYKPSYESIHKLIFRKFSLYGATTFWTQANYNGDTSATLTKDNMEWM